MSLIFHRPLSRFRRQPMSSLQRLGCACLAAICVALPLGCGERRDLGRVSPYSELVGHTYRVVGDLNSLGVKPLKSDVPPEYVMLQPRDHGYTGPEIAFTRPVPRGSTFRIREAWIYDTLLDDTIYYVVVFNEIGVVEQGLPVRIPLSGGNESSDGRLNAFTSASSNVL
jgi:hypothetical protein